MVLISYETTQNIHQVHRHRGGLGVPISHLTTETNKTDKLTTCWATVELSIENIKNCKFIDPMPKDDLFTYLQKEANVGLMILDNIPAFYFGTSPNKFFDYIALGLPVINNYPGWLAEMITNNNCGIAVNGCSEE